MERVEAPNQPRNQIRDAPCITHRADAPHGSTRAATTLGERTFTP